MRPPRRLRAPAPGARAPLLQRRSPPRPLRSLLLRALLVFALVGVALAGHWLDRAGLRDNTDGEISFVDVIYFTAITVTTVGYGDIVPVTERARLFDTLVVTPVRLFVWLIFLGTAYSFVLQHTWDRWRMSFIRRRLHDHVIVCGHGRTGAEAAAELVRRGCRPEAVVIVDCDEEALASAAAAGFVTLHGDATRNQLLETANIDNARAVVIAVDRDDAAILTVLTVRQLAPHARISVKIAAAENEVLARNAGADVIINPVSFGGQLLAGSTTGAHVAEYLSDLATQGGRVALRERAVKPAEVGRSLSEVSDGVGLRIYRGGRPFGFWEAETARLEADDTLVEIIPCGSAG